MAVMGDVEVTESDNDAPGLTLSDTSPSVREGDTTTYTVRLAAEPSATVTVSLTAAGDPDLSVMPASLTFTTTNWSQSQEVTVSAAEDDDLLDGTATLTHTASGGGVRLDRGSDYRHGDRQRHRQPCHRRCSGDGRGRRHGGLFGTAGHPAFRQRHHCHLTFERR